MFRRNCKFVTDSSDVEDGPSQAALLQVAQSKRQKLAAKNGMMRKREGPGRNKAYY